LPLITRKTRRLGTRSTTAAAAATTTTSLHHIDQEGPAATTALCPRTFSCFRLELHLLRLRFLEHLRLVRGRHEFLRGPVLGRFLVRLPPLHSVVGALLVFLSLGRMLEHRADKPRAAPATTIPTMPTVPSIARRARRVGALAAASPAGRGNRRVEIEDRRVERERGGVLLPRRRQRRQRWLRVDRPRRG
jgi:hypothetical protein